MEPKLNCRKDAELEELNQAGPRLRPVIGTISVSFTGAPGAKGKGAGTSRKTTCVRGGNVILLGS